MKDIRARPIRPQPARPEPVRPEPQAVRIELFGHAGSGKSTLADKLSEELNCLGLSSRVVHGLGRGKHDVRARRFGQVLGLALRPPVTVHGVRALRAAGARGVRSTVALGGLAYRQRNLQAAAGGHAVVLEDDGILHGTYQLLLLGQRFDERTTRALLRRLLRSPIAISVRPGVDTAARRQFLREKADIDTGALDALRRGHPLAGLSYPQLVAVLRRQERVLDLFEGVVRQRGLLLQARDGGTAGEVERLASIIARTSASVSSAA